MNKVDKKSKTLEDLGYENIKDKRYFKESDNETKKIEFENEIVNFYEYERKFGIVKINRMSKTFDEIIAIANVIINHRVYGK